MEIHTCKACGGEVDGEGYAMGGLLDADEEEIEGHTPGREIDEVNGAKSRNDDESASFDGSSFANAVRRRRMGGQ